MWIHWRATAQEDQKMMVPIKRGGSVHGMCVLHFAGVIEAQAEWVKVELSPSLHQPHPWSIDPIDIHNRLPLRARSTNQCPIPKNPLSTGRLELAVIDSTMHQTVAERLSSIPHWLAPRISVARPGPTETFSARH